VQFQETGVQMPGTVELAQPAVYSILDFSQPTDTAIAWQGQFLVEKGGIVNALRFITKNILAVVPEQNSTIDWLNHYMSLPMMNPVQVQAGDVLEVSFQYRAGGSIPSLEAALKVEVVREGVVAGAPQIAAYA
jgi:hypothetical protein